MSDSLKFLHGVEDNLPEEKQAGNVYFTTDEKKIYFDVPGNTVQRKEFGNQVLNELNSTNSAYRLTGTRFNTTNTGTQVFTNEVYVDKDKILHAPTFEGNLIGNATGLTVTSLGSNGTAIDFNNYYSKSFVPYAVSSNCVSANNPFGGSAQRFSFYTMPYSSTTYYQEAFNGSKKYYRTSNANADTWNPWYVGISTLYGTAVGAADTPVYINDEGTIVECSKYAGGTKVTLNGTDSSGKAISIYAPTESGTSGAFLRSNGSSAPTWVFLDSIYVNATGDTMTGDLEIKRENATYSYVKATNSNGSIGIQTSTNRGVRDYTTSKWLINTNTAGTNTYIPNWSSLGNSETSVYFNSNGQAVEGSLHAGGTKVTLNGSNKGSSSAEFYAPTTAGTSEQILKSNGSGAPAWVNQNAIAAGSATYTSNVRVTTTNPTESTTYSPVWVTNNPAANTNYVLQANDGFKYYTKEGTTTDLGYGTLVLGNNVNSGTAGNKFGVIRLYSEKDGHATLRAKSTQTSVNTKAYLPDADIAFLTYITDLTAVGNSKKPVYVDATGKITVCDYTLGTVSQKDYTDSTSASAIGTGTSIPTERDIYYGLPTINNVHNYTSSTTIYAPIAGGTSGYILKANGATSTPTWVAQSTITAGKTTQLATARKINSVSFNGTADITFATTCNTASPATDLPDGISYMELPTTAVSTGDPTYGALLTTKFSNSRGFQLALGGNGGVFKFRCIHTSQTNGYYPWTTVLTDKETTTLAVGGIYQYDLGNMSGKTITDLRTSLDTWLNTYCNYANASIRFVCSGNWIDLWNAENTTDTITAGSVWIATIVGTYTAKTYTQLRIASYTDKAVYYLCRSDSTWAKVHKIGFANDFVKKSGDTMTGNLTINHSDTTASSVTAKNSLSTISLNAATSGNRGLYDNTKSTWLVYNDTNGYTYYHTRAYNPSSETQCYLPFSGTSGSTGQYERYINNGIRYLTKEGTTSATGYGGLWLGNGTNKGTAGNKYGFLRMYGENTYKVDLRPNLSEMTANITVTLPKVTSRLLGTGDITFGTATPSGTATTGDIYIQI